MQRRHVLSILDLAPDEVSHLCSRALGFKRATVDPQPLRGKTVGIYFKKTSTRTRTAFVAGAARLGAHVIQYGPQDLQTNTGESLEDTARVLAGYLDVLVMRTTESVNQMKKFAIHPSLSIINALTEEEHPTQALADLTTIQEHFGRLAGIEILYLGEGNNTAAALALAVSRFKGMRLTLATPAGYGLAAGVLARAHQLASAYGAVIAQCHSIERVPRAVDVVYTTRWQTMGQSKPDPDWRKNFAPFAVTAELMARVSKPSGTVFLHDLPAVRGEDVADAVLDGAQSLAWVQAQNKLFSAMSVLEWCGSSTDTGVGDFISPVPQDALASV